MSARKPKVPRVGRPRAAAAAPEGPVRDAILSAARALFREQGFAATSTRQIAARVGLRQPSLFHYFPTKEAILRELALDTVSPVLTFIETERRRELPADVALYRLIRFDTQHLCTNENALGSPFMFPEISRDRLPEFWEMRDRIVARYRDLLRSGADQGLFVVQDASMVADLLFALVESVLLRAQSARRRQVSRLTQVTVELALRSVLADPRRLAAVRRRADAD